MEEPILNAIVTLRNEVSPWLMILQVVPDGWELPDYVPGHFTSLGLPGSVEEKRKLQKVVFPEGIVIDTKNREYLTYKVNSLFLAKSEFKRVSGGANKKLPIKSDEESSLVAGVVLLVHLWRTRESILGCFTTESLVRLRSQRSFLSLPL